MLSDDYKLAIRGALRNRDEDQLEALHDLTILVEHASEMEFLDAMGEAMECLPLETQLWWLGRIPDGHLN